MNEKHPSENSPENAVVREFSDPIKFDGEILLDDVA